MLQQGIKWESQALLLHLHKTTFPTDKLGQKHCTLTSDNRSASHFRVGYIYTINKHFMIILPTSFNAEVFGKCYQFWRSKKINHTVQIRYLERSQQIRVKRQIFLNTIPQILNQPFYLSIILNYQLIRVADQVLYKLLRQSQKMCHCVFVTVQATHESVGYIQINPCCTNKTFGHIQAYVTMQILNNKSSNFQSLLCT